MPATWVSPTAAQLHWAVYPSTGTTTCITTDCITNGGWTTTNATTTTANPAWWYVDENAVWYSNPAPHPSEEEKTQTRSRPPIKRPLREHSNQEAVRLRRQISDRELVIANRQREEAERQRRLAEERKQREAANKRAEEFLLDHLTPPQKETYKKNGWFVVEGGNTKTKYRIRKDGWSGNVDVYEADKIKHRLCCHIPAGKVPHGDHLLAQKLMLEFSEEDFLRLANRHAA